MGVAVALSTVFANVTVPPQRTQREVGRNQNGVVECHPAESAHGSRVRIGQRGNVEQRRPGRASPERPEAGGQQAADLTQEGGRQRGVHSQRPGRTRRGGRVDGAGELHIAGLRGDGRVCLEPHGGVVGLVADGQHGRHGGHVEHRRARTAGRQARQGAAEADLSVERDVPRRVDNQRLRRRSGVGDCLGESDVAGLRSERCTTQIRLIAQNNRVVVGLIAGCLHHDTVEVSRSSRSDCQTCERTIHRSHKRVKDHRGPGIHGERQRIGTRNVVDGPELNGS